MKEWTEQECVEAAVRMVAGYMQKKVVTYDVPKGVVPVEMRVERRKSGFFLQYRLQNGDQEWQDISEVGMDGDITSNHIAGLHYICCNGQKPAVYAVGSWFCGEVFRVAGVLFDKHHGLQDFSGLDQNSHTKKA